MYFYLLFIQCFNPQTCMCKCKSDCYTGVYPLLNLHLDSNNCIWHGYIKKEKTSQSLLSRSGFTKRLFFFTQAVNRQEYFRIQLISISHWSLKGTWNFYRVKPLFFHSFWEGVVNRVSARRRVRKTRIFKFMCDNGNDCNNDDDDNDDNEDDVSDDCLKKKHGFCGGFCRITAFPNSFFKNPCSCVRRT